MLNVTRFSIVPRKFFSGTLRLTQIVRPTVPLISCRNISNYVGLEMVQWKRNELQRVQHVRPTLIATSPSLLSMSNKISSLITRRNLHITRNMAFKQTQCKKSSFFEDGRPPQSPIRVFKIPYTSIIFGSFIFLTLFFMIIPILFQLLFPILLVGIAVFQFKKWRNNNFYRAVMQKLPHSSMKVSYKTLNSMAYRFLPNNFLKQFNVNTTDADTMMAMIQNRVIEAFNNNEQGMGIHYFPGKDNVKQFDDVLKLDIQNFKSFGNKIDGNFIMSMKYPLMYVEGTQRNHFADITITFLDDSMKRNEKFETILELSKTEGMCKMVISVCSAKLLFPQPYIISTPGETGSFNGKYKIRTTADGHREFTIEKDD
ncbi:hypothetical protein C6P45_002841 [Maudiozyma exigua]|uniref:Uncharacterized protein n=1 Tax=Maudiozyma exigua TaxID=34358 RepID=A0A9P6WCS5_MAUEX|nr:hypothetical protein C6P45_002841 [Kazachstania exigua]